MTTNTNIHIDEITVYDHRRLLNGEGEVSCGCLEIINDNHELTVYFDHRQQIDDLVVHLELLRDGLNETPTVR